MLQYHALPTREHWTLFIFISSGLFFLKVIIWKQILMIKDYILDVFNYYWLVLFTECLLTWIQKRIQFVVFGWFFRRMSTLLWSSQATRRQMQYWGSWTNSTRNINIWSSTFLRRNLGNTVKKEPWFSHKNWPCVFLWQSTVWFNLHACAARNLKHFFIPMYAVCIYLKFYIWVFCITEFVCAEANVCSCIWLL